MVTHFYFQLQKKSHTNLENYFTGRKNELYIFAESLLQNKQISEIIREEFYYLAKDLNIKDRIDELELDYSIKVKNLGNTNISYCLLLVDSYITHFNLIL